MKKIIWMVPLVFLYMVGCSAVKLTDATTGSRARVRFVAEAENYTVVYGYQTENCKNEEEWMVLRNGHYLLVLRRGLGYRFGITIRMTQKNSMFQQKDR